MASNRSSPNLAFGFGSRCSDESGKGRTADQSAPTRRLADAHLVHADQHYDNKMSDDFFDVLGRCRHETRTDELAAEWLREAWEVHSSHCGFG